MSQSRRDYYRLRYPIGHRPQVWIDELQYELIELSERGTRLHDRNATLQAGQVVTGAISFSDGETVPFEGPVMRREKDEVVIGIEIGISTRRVVEEQRLIARQLS